MSARTKHKFQQLLVLLGAWIAFAIVMTLYDHLIINSMNANGASSFYSIQYALVSNCISALIGGLTGGSFLIFVIDSKFDNKPILSTVLTATVVYLGVIAVIVMVITGIACLHGMATSTGAPKSWDVVKRFLTDDTRIKNVFTWYCVVAITQVILQINKRFGEGNLLRILKGQYNVAHHEEKIFMFLDLNDSTTLAERLGDEKYHSLLRDFFADISDDIVNNGGKIYQYVGDEVVVQWDYQDNGFERSMREDLFRYQTEDVFRATEIHETVWLRAVVQSRPALRSGRRRRSRNN
ncbi:MAG: hypothetical protein QM762_00945 [Chryseolinea sp.]